VNVVADQHAAGLERRVPGEPEVLAVDRRAGPLLTTVTRLSGLFVSRWEFLLSK
jgi:hypothetical protein